MRRALQSGIRPLVRTSALLALACLTLPLQVHARNVADLEAINQELEIARDVFRSAMAHAVGQRLRVTGVDTQYLARQGVLVSMSIVMPWIDVDEFTERSLDLSTEVETLHDIPELVYEIMTELNIAIAPYDPDLLEELRALREEQGVLRSAQRQLRAQLRESRRERNRLDGDTDALDERIGELEKELNALVDDYEALNADIDELYELLQSKREVAGSGGSFDLDAAVGETACNYGNTFRSLGSQQFLTVSVKFENRKRYFVFRMENVSACRRGDIDVERLLTRAWVYDG